MTGQPEPWARSFVGLPFVEHGRNRRGADCWGLGVVLYREVAGIALPAYAEGYTDTADVAHLASLVARAQASAPFLPVLERLEGEAPTPARTALTINEKIPPCQPRKEPMHPMNRLA